MQQFFRTHPQWQHTPPLPAGFHWKWYYAFQQLGDERVAPQVAAYREGLLARQRWSERLGWLLPGVGVQAILHHMAATDLPAQLSFRMRLLHFILDCVLTTTPICLTKFDLGPMTSPKYHTSGRHTRTGLYPRNQCGRWVSLRD